MLKLAKKIYLFIIEIFANLNLFYCTICSTNVVSRKSMNGMLNLFLVIVL